MIDDLFSLIYPQKEKYLSDDMIHPNADGAKLLGTAVANCIRKAVPARTKSVSQTP